jgi:hypothetical protein
MGWLGSWFDWQVFGMMVAKITAAYVLALPIGWEREQVQHSVGLRTFPLVAMASCGYVLLADTFIGGHLAGVDAAARSRIIQGLTTGIGFICGGAIMRGRGNDGCQYLEHGRDWRGSGRIAPRDRRHLEPAEPDHAAPAGSDEGAPGSHPA